MLPIFDASPAPLHARSVLGHPAIRPVFGLILLSGIGYALWTSWHDPSWDALPVDFQLGPLALSLLLRLCTSAIMAVTWLFLFRGMGGRLGERDGFHIYLVSAIAKYLPGKVMLVAGRAMMVQERGQPAALGMTSTLLEAGFSLLGAAFVGIGAFVLVQGQAWSEHGGLIGWSVIAMLLVLVPGLIGLHPRILGPVLQIAARIAPRRLALDLGPPPAYTTSLIVFSAHVLSRAVGACALFAIVVSVHPVDAGLLPLLAGASAASYLLGFALPFAPAGLGAREGMLTLVLATVMPAPVAAIISVLDRIASVVAELLAAGLAVLVAGRRSRTAPVTAALPVTGPDTVTAPELPSL
jgi:glycosyltransferase 2 family protein